MKEAHASTVTDSVRVWLRAEGLAVLLAGTWWFVMSDGNWWLFGVLFFAPDVSCAGYLAGPRTGAIVYNIAHTYVSPVVLAGAFVIAGRADALPFLAIWCAHIGFDRAMGYGLKYPTAFGDTHLGFIGRGTSR